MEDIYEQEEKCQKALKTLRKAIFMRLVVAGVMIWAVAVNSSEAILWGLALFVLVVNAAGALPLIAEWKKQHSLLKNLIAQENK